MNDPIVISDALVIDRWTGNIRLVGGREKYVLLLADTIKDPVEIWVYWVKTPNGKYRIVKRYIGIYKDGKKRGGFTVFDLLQGTWRGTTGFPTKDLKYLDKQRVGILIYERQD